MGIFQSRHGLSKTRVFLMLAMLYLSTMCTMADLLITPLANDLYEIFAGAPTWLISFGITGTSLSAIPFMIISGLLCDRIDKKKIMVGGFMIYMIGGIFGGLIVNIYYFVFMRFLVGAAWGITNTAAFTILSDFFNDDGQAHAQSVSGYSISVAIAGASLSLLGGMLAVQGWRNVFYGYWISIPVLVGLIILLPSLPPVTKKSESAEGHVTVPNNWWTKLIPLTLQIIFIAGCYFQIQYMVSFYVADSELGNVAFAGMLISFEILSTAGGALVYPILKKKLGDDKVYMPGVLLVGLSFLAMAFYPTRLVAIIACSCIGFGYITFYCYFYSHYANLVPVEKLGTATSIVGICEALAGLSTSYVLVWLIGLSPNGSSVQIWWIFGAVPLAVLVISIVFLKIRPKRMLQSDICNIQDEII